MVEHVHEADRAYIGALGAKTPAATADRARGGKGVRRGAAGQGPRRAAGKGTSRRRSLASALCRPSLGVARAGSRLGDRGPLSL